MTRKSMPHATHGHRGHVPTSAAKSQRSLRPEITKKSTRTVSTACCSDGLDEPIRKTGFGQGLNSAVLHYPSKTFSFIILDPSRRSNLGPLDLEKEVTIFELAQGLLMWLRFSLLCVCMCVRATHTHAQFSCVKNRACMLPGRRIRVCRLAYLHVLASVWTAWVLFFLSVDLSIQEKGLSSIQQLPLKEG